jgi:hypothetical protein
MMSRWEVPNNREDPYIGVANMRLKTAVAAAAAALTSWDSEVLHAKPSLAQEVLVLLYDANSQYRERRLDARILTELYCEVVPVERRQAALDTIRCYTQYMHAINDKVVQHYDPTLDKLARQLVLMYLDRRDRPLTTYSPTSPEWQPPEEEEEAAEAAEDESAVAAEPTSSQ